MDSFPHIHCIFYAEFDIIQGPRVVYQVPEGFVYAPPRNSTLSTLPIVPDTFGVESPFMLPGTPQQGMSGNSSSRDIQFDALSEYILPKQELHGRLVAISTQDFKIVGLPVSIEDPKYERNTLLFNVCFVFDREAATGCYDQVVRKIARELKALELECDLIHNPATKPEVLNIIEQLMHDLNTYFECQIPISSLRSQSSHH